ncbi:tetratricopeptide repeat protein [Clostridium tarantellae]|uniref:Tetratricopeptide repeat protein n=1 Tax=Clostridium tarantellae TaxID=39493 RepID=A0A6I1MLJ0_9CLOT|nr:tetratricopeptide repeat protein [Clostridium tarantellae]MPQ43864.1 tetratricopeptide repeat protein [Clostridium tarantellae]
MNISNFLKEIDDYIGEYSKNHEVNSGNKILRICEKYEKSCNEDFIFYYYKAFAYTLLKEFKEGLKIIKKSIKLNSKDEKLFLLRGKCYEEEEIWDSALADYIKAYELNENCVEAILKIGFSFMEDGDYNEALNYFEKANMLKEDNKSNFAISSAYYELGDYEKALKHIDRAIEIKDNISDYYINRALINRILGHFNKADKDYKKAIELDSDNPQYPYYLSTLYLDNMEFWKATLILNNLIERFPKYLENYSLLSRCYLEMGNTLKALNIIEKALIVDKYNKGFRYIKADIHLEREEYYLAEKEYLNLIENGDNSVYIFNTLVRVYMTNEDYDKAIKIINQCIKENYDNVYLNRNLAYCYFYKENYENAIKYFSHVINYNEEEVLDYSYRARCYYLLNKDKEAEKDYLKVLSLDKNDETAYFYLGYIYYYNSDYEKCIKNFLHYVNIGEEDFEIYQSIAECYMKLNNFVEACKWLEYTLKGIDYFENKAQIYTQLGVCYGRCENLTKALECYNMALKFDEEYTLAHYNKGLIYFKNKEYKKAINEYNIALKIDKENHYIFYNRGLVYEKLEYYNLAEKDYIVALQINKEPVLYEEIAWVCFMQKKYKQAILNYKLAIDNGIKEGYTYANLGKVYKHIKNYEVAIKYFKIALDLEKDLKKSFCKDITKNLAFCYMKISKYEESINWCKNFIKYYENEGDIYAILAISYNFFNEQKLALKNIEKALEYDEFNEFNLNELNILKDDLLEKNNFDLL